MWNETNIKQRWNLKKSDLKCRVYYDHNLFLLNLIWSKKIKMCCNGQWSLVNLLGWVLGKSNDLTHTLHRWQRWWIKCWDLSQFPISRFSSAIPATTPVFFGQNAPRFNVIMMRRKLYSNTNNFFSVNFNFWITLHNFAALSRPNADLKIKERANFQKSSVLEV